MAETEEDTWDSDFHIYNIMGSGGFEELKKYVKQGNEFCKDIGSVMQERADAEATYAKVLLRLSGKLNKTACACIGTLAEAWSVCSAEMDAEAELHRQLAQSLSEDLCKPMKNLAEQQAKTRKPIISRVETSQKALADKRADENKNKKNAFSYAKEREKLSDTLLAGRGGGRAKTLTDKEIARLEKKIRSLEDSIRKCDKEYLESSEKAEGARQEWESSVYKASGELQKLEEERISQMQDFLNKYNSHRSVIGPKLIKSCDKLGEAVLSVDTNSDLRKVVDQKGTGPNQPEQILPDFYAEDNQNGMERERRRQALQNYLIYLQQDIERETKGKEGVEKLIDVYQNKPQFADSDAQEDTRQKLQNVTYMLNFLEACHHKVTCSMAELDGRPKPSSRYSQSMERTKDKQGHVITFLRMPMSAVSVYQSNEAASSIYRAPADGGHVDSPYAKAEHNSASAELNPIYTKVALPARQASVVSSRRSVAPPAGGQAKPPLQQYDSVSTCYSDDDEFEFEHPPITSQCRVIYDYLAQLEDELTIKAGEIVAVYDKQADGWWQGELNGKVGIFPATYVEELQGVGM